MCLAAHSVHSRRGGLPLAGRRWLRYGTNNLTRQLPQPNHGARVDLELLRLPECGMDWREDG
jgi:hypothetical protein